MSDIFILDCFPPSVNQLYGGTHYGGRYLSKKHKELRAIVKQAVDGKRCGFALATVRLDLFPKDARRRDVDNYTKGVFDSLTACGYWSDDDIVKKLIVVLHPKTEKDQTIIRVYPYEEKQENVPADQ